VRVKVRVADGEPVPDGRRHLAAANWLEREVFDMFGVRSTAIPDLRRILMPDDWQGHPQRKDYPLEGPGELLIESRPTGSSCGRPRGSGDRVDGISYRTASTPEPSAMFDTDELVINMGPQHPSTHGVLRLVLRLDGERSSTPTS
jgi:NADH-quinone oxidoreductase subunit C/D